MGKKPLASQIRQRGTLWDRVALAWLVLTAPENLIGTLDVGVGLEERARKPGIAFIAKWGGLQITTVMTLQRALWISEMVRENVAVIDPNATAETGREDFTRNATFTYNQWLAAVKRAGVELAE